MRRLAEALLPFFAEVRWGLVSGAVRGAAATVPATPPGSTHTVNRVHWRLPQVPPTGGALLDWLTGPAVEVCTGWPKPDLDQALHDASLVVVESGPLAAFIERFRRQAPQAELVYLATVRLTSPDVHPRVAVLLQRDAVLVDRAVTTVRALLPGLSIFGRRARFVPAGQDLSHRAASGTPLENVTQAVVLDVAKFDASVVQIAASMVPGTQFDVLGPPSLHNRPSNVVLHGPLPPEEAAGLLDGATLAIVPDATDPPDLVAVSPALDRLQHLGVAGGLPQPSRRRRAPSVRIRDGAERLDPFGAAPRSAGKTRTTRFGPAVLGKRRSLRARSRTGPARTRHRRRRGPACRVSEC